MQKFVLFAFHLIGDSPSGVDAQLTGIRSGFRAAQARLNRSKILAANIDLGKEQGDKFLASYMTSRRHTFSTILGEISGVAKLAGMKMGDANYAVPDPIEGSEDLDMLTITANFEGTYPQLLKFVNLLDRSPRFLLIEGLQVTPQPKGDLLSITIKMNTFVKDDKEGVL
jgi:type IV pilus assembly protein PilO